MFCHNIIFFFSDNYDSYLRRVTSEECYVSRKKRSVVSLQVCYMSSMFELLAVVSSCSTSMLIHLGLRYTYYPDAVVMFVIVPTVYILNDEDTKFVIYSEGWYQGIRHMLGVYTEAEHAT